MGRDKKGKKGQGGETGEEVVLSKEENFNDDTTAAESGKKGKNKKNGDFRGKPKLDDLVNEDDEKISDKKSKQSKKGKQTENAEPEESKDVDEKKDMKKKKSKKDKISSQVTGEKVISEKVEMEVSDEDGPELTSNRNSAASRKKPSVFQMLDIDGDDDDASDAPMEVEEEVEAKKEEPKPEAKGGKKSKKKERRKKDDDDEDISKLLEELALEMTGQAPPQSESQAPKAEPAAEPAEDKPSKKKKGKSKKDEPEEKAEKTEEREPSVETVEEEESHTVKTAAQKKKEKKEKERLKKIAEFEQSEGKKKTTKKAEKKPKTQEAAEPVVSSVSPDKEDVPKVLKEDEPEAPKDDADDDGVEDGSKKKKKKKKVEEDDKKDKKRPGKRQIAAMQEALKKVQEEEEKMRLEQEAKLKAEEEAELLRQEKARLEQERKEKKKQKEKEKRERLKAEGKLLSKTQRQNRARMEATLAALRQQGVQVPLIGEKKEAAPRLGDRKRPPRKKSDPAQVAEDSSTEVKEVVEVEKPADIPEVKEEDSDDVKDAWDDSSEEESDEQSTKVTKPGAKTRKHSSGESTDESESEGSDESDSEESESDDDSDSEDDGRRNEERMREKVIERIRKRREENENKRDPKVKLRSPVVCVLGHVDTGKTKILDKIRRTHVQDSEAGGITQQIGATMVPQEALQEQCRMAKGFSEMELKFPGLLIIDTPGHESFSNLRSRGSSLCDIAVLVVDIMHGLEPQTIESINLLKEKKTPFIVALNKIDRLYEWKSNKNKDIQDVIKNQARNTKMEFEDRAKDIILQFANQGLNAVLYYENTNPRSYISMVPTSAVSGDGMGNLLALVVQLSQQMMAKRLAFSEELQATVLEVKAIPGLGTTIDIILVNGCLREGDTIVLAGYEGPFVTQIRSLLMPQPLKEMRVKNPYEEFKEVEASQGVKLTGKELDKTIAGLQMLVAYQQDEVPILKEEVASSFREAMSCMKGITDRGVYVQASTLGSLEALLDFLRTSKIPYAGIRIGPVVKKDVIKASVMLEHDSQYAVILAFDVKIEKEAQELADSLGVKVFQADIIYHLFDKFTAYREELKNKKREEFKNIAVFPCKLRILPQYIFNSRDPLVFGVIVEAGVVKEGTPICVPSKEFLDLGAVTTIEVNHKTIESARKGQEVCIKIESTGSDAPKMYGRHFDHTDILVSKICRESIDACKEHFRDDLLKTDWQLMIELKKTFQI